MRQEKWTRTKLGPDNRVGRGQFVGAVRERKTKLGAKIEWGKIKLKGF